MCPLIFQFLPFKTMSNTLRESLKTKLILSFLLVSLIPIVIVGYMSFEMAKKAIVETRIAGLESTADMKVDKIESFFNERIGDIMVAQDYYNIKTNLQTVSKYAKERTNPIYLNSKTMLDKQLRTFQTVYGYKDLMLVNTDGIIVYNTNEYHYAADLDRPLPDPGNKAFENGKKGIYISTVFEDRVTANKYEILITAPAYDSKQNLIGVIVLEVDMDQIYKFIQNTTGLSSTGETLIGQRSENKAVFLNPLRHEKDTVLKKRVTIGSNIAIPLQEAVEGRNGSGISIDYRNKKVISVWRNIPSINWGLVAKIDTSDAFRPVYVLGIWIIAIAVIVFIIVAVIAYFITRKISRPIVELTLSTELISKGDLTHHIDIVSKNEIGVLAGSFNKMTEDLRNSQMILEKKNWLKTGQSELNNVMHGEQSIENLGRNIITFLADYLNAQIGTIYLVKKNKDLKQIGNFAYKKNKPASTEIKSGEGLVGQAALEKRAFTLSNVPEDYITINSSLGEAVPRSIIVVPFLYENNVKGVMELGSFGNFSDIELELIKSMSENIAIAFNSAQAREHMRDLLEKTRIQAEELQNQQEELKVTNEELQSQQEELLVSNEELADRSQTLEKGQKEIRQKNAVLEETKIIIENKAKELELASRYKSEFLANMSHELRTPLNSLLILSKYLEDNKDKNLTAKQIECARTIYSAGNDLLTLINDILDLSKIESGKIELEIVDVSIKEIAAKIKENFQPVADDKGLNFKIDFGSALPDSICTDSQKFHQIVKNLLSNSFKFTKTGEISLLFHRPDKDITLSKANLTADNTIAVSIIDTGIGIREDKQELIFVAFQQADGTTSRKYGGTGLGLSISKELANTLGGEIHMQSEPGKGSTFTLYLPETIKGEGITQTPESETELPEKMDKAHILKAKQSEPVSINDDRKTVQAEDKSILVIEDDTRFAKILCEFAQEKGYKTLMTETGEEGIDMAIKYLPSAIILDLGLPGINGWDVMRCFKDNPQTRHIPVHFISATDSHNDAMKMGAIGFLTKPVSIENLNSAFNKIENLISKSVKKLLVVEDDEILAKSILELIRGSDVSSTNVSTGHDAYDMLQSEKFDCVILDIGLPDMSGSDLLEKIKNNKKISDIPIIIYTGKDLSRKEEEQLQKYASRIIIKGAYSPERLLDEVALFLHLVEDNLPEEQKQMLKMVHDKDHMFINKKLLIVDDDIRNVFALTSVLEERGLTVIVGKNGREGIESLKKNPDTDLVLMDIMMPEMDGYEAMENIRKMHEFHDLPIIALTAKAMHGDRDKCIKSGANDYLAKPIDTNKLLSLLRVWLYK